MRLQPFLLLAAVLVSVTFGGDVKINCGGENLKNGFRCDTGRFSSSPSSTGGKGYFDNTYRYSTKGNLVYSIPVPPGTYTVHMWFKEPNPAFEEGDRVFTVAINGKLANLEEKHDGQPLDIVDVVDQNFMFFNAYKWSPVGGKITITLGRQKGNPLIYGIAILGKNADGVIGDTDKYSCQPLYADTKAPKSVVPAKKTSKPSSPTPPKAPAKVPAPKPAKKQPKPTPPVKVTAPKPPKVTAPPKKVTSMPAQKPTSSKGAPGEILVPKIGKWETIATYPFLVAEGAGGVMEGQFVAFGGLTERYKSTTAKSYAMTLGSKTKKWRRLTDMPGLLTHVAQAFVGSKMYAVGAYAGISHTNWAVKQSWVYNMKTNKWSRLPDLPQARGAGALAVVANRWLVFTGGNVRSPKVRYPTSSKADRADTWVLDIKMPGKGWSKQQPIPRKRNHFGAITTCGRSFFIGGQIGDQYSNGNVPFVDEFVPCGKGGGKWVKRANSPHGLGHSATGMMPYKCGIIAVGGMSNGGSWGTHRTEVMWYSPMADKWYKIGSYPTTVFGPLCGIYGGNKLVCGVGETRLKKPKAIYQTTITDKMVPCDANCKKAYKATSPPLSESELAKCL